MPSKFLAHSTGNFVHISEFNKIKDDYILKNLKKLKAIRMGNVWVTKQFYPNGKPNKSYMPDTIKCYVESPKSPAWIQIPPGLRSTIPFESHYDNQVIEHPDLLRPSRDYQTSTIQATTMMPVGLIEASTGAGKTQMICDLTARLKRNTLIMVQNLSQMEQMVADIESILGVIPTQVSGKKPSKKAQATWYPYITVCSIDSRDKITPGNFGSVLLDEADTYLGSDERRAWIGSLSNEYIYALTGTTKVNDMEDKVFDIYYGEKTVLKLLNHTPHYTQVLSDFRFHLDDQSQFHELKEALYTSEKRNALIAEVTARNVRDGRKGLVFTEHVQHARTLEVLLQGAGIKTYVLIGEVSKDERERIRSEVRDYRGACVIIGSVKIIGRGFDLPELSFAVLTTAERFTANIQQYVGRLARHHPDKPQAMFYDIVDNLQPLLNNQSISRLRTYKKEFKDGKTFIKTNGNVS